MNYILPNCIVVRRLVLQALPCFMCVCASSLSSHVDSKPSKNLWLSFFFFSFFFIIIYFYLFIFFFTFHYAAKNSIFVFMSLFYLLLSVFVFTSSFIYFVSFYIYFNSFSCVLLSRLLFSIRHC